MTEHGNNASEALTFGLAELRELEDQHKSLRKRARGHLDDIKHLLIGRRVKRFGKVFQITQAQISINGGVAVGGVTVRGKKVGTRVFDVGLLSLCEMIEEAPDDHR